MLRDIDAIQIDIIRLTDRSQGKGKNRPVLLHLNILLRIGFKRFGNALLQFGWNYLIDLLLPGIQ